MFKKHNYLNIGGYTDANWARDNIDKKIHLRIFHFCGRKLSNQEKSETKGGGII